VDGQELADIDEFAAVAPQMQIQEARVFVEGEDEICVGDVATLQVRLLRSNLREGEAAGAAHTPLFPGAQVPEAWWLLWEGKGKGAKSMCKRLVDPSREVVADVKFRVPSAGKSSCRFFLVCEAYAGLDLEQVVSFTAKKAPKPQDDGSGSGEDEDPFDFEQD